jgi:hypothetical protein
MEPRSSRRGMKSDGRPAPVPESPWRRNYRGSKSAGRSGAAGRPALEAIADTGVPATQHTQRRPSRIIGMWLGRQLEVMSGFIRGPRVLRATPGREVCWIHVSLPRADGVTAIGPLASTGLDRFLQRPCCASRKPRPRQRTSSCRPTLKAIHITATSPRAPFALR